MEYLLRISKGIVLVLILMCIGTQVIQPADSTVAFKTVQKATLNKVDLDSLSSLDNKAIKRYLKLNPDDYASVKYYRSTDTMQADEIVLVKFKSHEQHEAFRRAMNDRKQEQLKVYEGYQPTAVKLLKQSELTIHANYGLFVVHKDADTITAQFLGSLD